jgi:hypothetical protein
LSNFWLFLQVLPELLKLFQLLQKRIEEVETDRKVKDDVKKIHEAFATNDASKLDELFKQTSTDKL